MVPSSRSPQLAKPMSKPLMTPKPTNETLVKAKRFERVSSRGIEPRGHCVEGQCHCYHGFIGDNCEVEMEAWRIWEKGENNKEYFWNCSWRCHWLLLVAVCCGWLAGFLFLALWLPAGQGCSYARRLEGTGGSERISWGLSWEKSGISRFQEIWHSIAWVLTKKHSVAWKARVETILDCVWKSNSRLGFFVCFTMQSSSSYSHNSQ